MEIELQLTLKDGLKSETWRLRLRQLQPQENDHSSDDGHDGEDDNCDVDDMRRKDRMD